MLILFALFFCALGYIIKSYKNKITLMDESLLDKPENDDNLFKDLDDLFVCIGIFICKDLTKGLVTHIY